MARHRKNFSKATQIERFRMCGGRCEGLVMRDGRQQRCNVVLKVGNYHVDHDNPDGLTGEPTIENARCLCLPCHAAKTKIDVGNIAEAKRRAWLANRPAQPPSKIPSRDLPQSSKPRRERHPEQTGMTEIQRRYGL